jgi:hypothetical protein
MTRQANDGAGARVNRRLRRPARWMLSGYWGFMAGERGRREPT